MRAVVIEAKGGAATLSEVDEHALLSGDVEIDALYSSLNYKDGLAIAGTGVARAWPLVPGIDLVGQVTGSSSPDWAPGDMGVEEDPFSRWR